MLFLWQHDDQRFFLDNLCPIHKRRNVAAPQAFPAEYNDQGDRLFLPCKRGFINQYPC